MKVYILDCNDEIIGNPKGYATLRGAEREAWGRVAPAIRAKFDEKHSVGLQGGINPQGSCRLFSIRSFAK